MRAGADDIGALGTAELFVLSALRTWRNGVRHDEMCCCRNLLRNGFQAAGLSARDFQHFDRLTLIIDAALAAPAWIAELRTPRVTCEERRYLDLIAQAQHGSARQTLHALAAWLPPAVARVAVAPCVALAQSCAAAGLVWPLTKDGRRLPRGASLTTLH